MNINVAYNEVLLRKESGDGMCYMNNLTDTRLHPLHNIYSKTKQEIEEEFGVKFPIQITPNTPNEITSKIGLLLTNSLDYIIGNSFNNFRSDTLDYFVTNKLPFIYPITLYSNDVFEEGIIDFPSKLITSVKEKLGKIIFLQPTEGFFGENDLHYKWFSDLSSFYGLDKEDIVMITCNLASKQRQNELIYGGIIKDNFTVYEYSFFQYNHWFIHGHTMYEHVKNTLVNIFNDSIKSNKENLKTKHFLCFNRVPKIHRIVMFTELMSNINFKDKFITSLGATSDFNYIDLESNINHIGSFYGEKNNFLNFLRNYDFNKEYVFDEDNLKNNKANVFNLDAHRSTFLNVVTESLIHDNNVIFFSEKTFKPMISAQPFIIVGNPGSIEKLKECGFRTFDKWWDESYDLERNLYKRIEKITNVMLEISTWDYEKCYRVTQEMEETLIHNLNVLMNLEDTINLMNFLSKRNEEIIIKKRRLI